jgi:segregation and condensation protein B
VSFEGADGRQGAAALEAVLMVATEPVPPRLLAELLELSVERVEALCAELSTAYEAEERGFVLARVAGGYRFESHPAYAGFVERFVTEGMSPKLSAAALETLAVIAYRQPVSRAQVAAIRGVNADGVVRLLTQRGYVAPVARDPGPGQAVLYGTTPLFLERLGLDHLGQLPALADFVPGPDLVEALERGLRDRVDPRRANSSSASDPEETEPEGPAGVEPEEADREAAEGPEDTGPERAEGADPEEAQPEGVEPGPAEAEGDGYGTPSAEQPGRDGFGG